MGLRDGNPTSTFERLPRLGAAPYIMNMDDVDRLLEAAHELACDARVGPRRQAGYARRVALLEIMYASGMRVSEAVSLPSSDFIDPKVRAILIEGRGGRQRWVLLHSKAVEAVIKWKGMAHEIGLPSSMWAFHSIGDGEGHLARGIAFKEIKEIAEIAGLPEADKISPKALRHAFGAHLLANGADLNSVQAMLGYADVGTMEMYAGAMPDETLATLRKHPLSEPLRRS
jgi:integrase/recombinase XerD